ncbi:MAG: GNAT family N-acyltransferase [Desulfonauticus sp.]|nr:GNAT family N-acyltransferase [Desulfonauticus sp.]
MALKVRELIHQSEKFSKLANKMPGPVTNGLIRMLEIIVHERDINAFLQAHQHLVNFCFIEAGLEFLNVSYKVSNTDKENIPPEGRVVIIANHPLAGIDSLALLSLIGEIRKDVKMLATGLVTRIEPIKDLLIPVDNFSSKISKMSFQKIEQCLENEEALIIFPAGEVSRASFTGIKDGRWKAGFLKIARKYKAPILPVFIRGRISLPFYLTSIVCKKFSTILLPHEMLKYRSKLIEFKIGELIPYESFSESNIYRTVKLFKKHVYRLGKNKKILFETQKSIAHPEKRKDLKQALKSSTLLSSTRDGKKIFFSYFTKDKVALLREIGRLREMAFRKVGEGTGKRRDIDQYDLYYGHIVLWDEEKLEIVGSYRLGEGPKILYEKGEEGFYLRSLCKFGTDFVSYLEQGVELGRSFVQPQYWGSRALDYLWQGIGAYLKNNQQVRYLFGPVSISASMPKNAVSALVYYYSHYYGARQPCMVPKFPYALENPLVQEFKNYFTHKDMKKDFILLKQYLRQFQTSIPTLLKQYCDIFEPGGITIHGFGIDKDFGSIDGFILADLQQIKPEKKKRYLI